MSALGNLYKDDDDDSTDEQYDDDDEQRSGSYADDDDDRRQAEEGEPSEETLEEEDSEKAEQEDSDRRDSDNEEDSDRRASDHEESESDRDVVEREQSVSENDEDQKSDGYGREESETETGREDSKREDSYGADEFEPKDEDDERDFEVYPDDDPENFPDEPVDQDPEKPLDRSMGAGSGGMTSSQKTCLICCCFICIIIALIGGAVIGAILTDSDSSFRDVLGIEEGDDGGDCRNEDLEPTPVFSCDEDNINLEFRIVFDARPGEVGVNVSDPFGIKMWNFPPRSFGSFALLLRENIFTLCLSPIQNYTFELTDTGENGFVSNLSGVEIFGSFSLLYDDVPVTTYNGDCNATSPSLECGMFCKCTYMLAVNASSGSCTTEC